MSDINFAGLVSNALYEYSGKVSFSNWDGTTAKPLAASDVQAL